MEILVGNLRGNIRRQKLHGREHIVAPLSLIVPGVLNGSAGPLYYPADEIAKNPTAWNGMPIVVYHPTRNGSNITARDPDILDTQGVGIVLRSKISKGRLVAEGWFDVAALTRIDNRILNALEAGEQIELSTGLYTVNDPMPGTYNGREYTYVARNYQPDHLAILPDQVGACSIQDGCGVLVNAANKWQELVCNCESKWTPIFTGETVMALSEQDRKNLIDNLVANCDCWKADGDREILNKMGDEKLLQLKEHAAREQQITAVANAAAGGFKDGKTGKAYRVNPQSGKWELMETPVENEEETDNAKMPMDDEEDDDMPEGMSAAGKKKMKARMTKNKKPQTTDDWLRSAPTEVQNTIRYAQQIEQQKKDELIEKLLVNVAASDRAAHQERLQRRTIDELHNDLALIPRMPTKEELAAAQKPAQQTRQVENREDADMLGLPVMNWQPADKQERQEQQQQESVQNLNEDDWLNKAPASIRSVVSNAMAVERAEKKKIVDVLTANISDEDTDKRLTARLMSKSLEELRDLAALAPAKEAPRPNYFGAAAPLANLRPLVDNRQDDILLPPSSINFEDHQQQRRA